MSIATEITRLQGLRNDLRTKLVALGLATSDDDLDALVTAVEGIAGRGGVTGTITTKAGAYTIAAGYHDGSGYVSISNAEQAKIIAGNIKAGVIILGVEGTYTGEGATYQVKTVTPTTSAQEITADDGYDALQKVTVNPIPSGYALVTAVTATAADVLANKVFVSASGAETAGTMTNNGAVAQTINGTTVLSYTVPQGYHSGSGTVSLDSTIETALAAI